MRIDGINFEMIAKLLIFIDNYTTIMMTIAPPLFANEIIYTQRKKLTMDIVNWFLTISSLILTISVVDFKFSQKTVTFSVNNILLILTITIVTIFIVNFNNIDGRFENVAVFWENLNSTINIVKINNGNSWFTIKIIR